jgi:hypothetical protein
VKHFIFYMGSKTYSENQRGCDLQSKIKNRWIVIFLDVMPSNLGATHCHVPEDRKFDTQCRETLKSGETK